MPDVWRHGSFKASKWLPPPLQLLPWLAFPIAPANAAFTAVTAFAVPMTPLHSLLLNGLEGGGAGAFSSPTGGGARLAERPLRFSSYLRALGTATAPPPSNSPVANVLGGGGKWPCFAKGIRLPPSTFELCINWEREKSEWAQSLEMALLVDKTRQLKNGFVQMEKRGRTP